ncbi:MAG TPA: DNA polymerase ligase N-terminal domain-containing protein [Candidatus Nanoarchaeia archaeon]|nr:DNA polymerase ligase N-terminal domain-containing protein [Candidatus Nanoarchaeia archaeon]
MSLAEYKKKRDFKKTSEPSGIVKKAKSKKLIYCIQKHHASHLHYDLRLEMLGVLKSWAIPKEPPREKGIKRLAVMTEDHPIEYGKFHGTIPEGNYGAGKVEIWDKGFYELKISDSKKIEFFIHGNKLKGNYVLVKTHYGSRPEKSWLFMKV